MLRLVFVDVDLLRTRFLHLITWLIGHRRQIVCKPFGFFESLAGHRLLDRSNLLLKGHTALEGVAGRI